jgi:hypothetical protein
MTSDKKTLLEGAAASPKSKHMSVGGHADTPVDLVTAGNADAKHPCLGNGQTVLMRTPTQAEFVECWSETIIRTGIPLAVVDHPLFRKGLVITSRMGQTAVCMGKGTALGKKHTTLSHRDTFTSKIIPATNKRLDEENMVRHTILSPSRVWTKLSKPIKGLDETIRTKMHNVFMSRWSDFHAPVYSAAFAMDRQFCRRDMDPDVKKDIWSVMEDFYKTPRGKDLSKMKSQYDMFVDVVGSKQVTV